MRLWTCHPRHLDSQGLVALWREGLLAKAVLENKTRGYRHHPQLLRFRAHQEPALAIIQYLHSVLADSLERGYNFDASKLPPPVSVDPIIETAGQMIYEWHHLLQKLERRSPAVYEMNRNLPPSPHPIFRIVPGNVQTWEKTPEST